MATPDVTDAEPRPGSPAGAVTRASLVMAAGTLVSRVTGFVRNVVVVAALGTALFADAYQVANTIPNILYILLIGGALNAVFVPQISRAVSCAADRGAAYLNRLVTVTVALLLAITIAAVAGAPLIVGLYADFGGAQQDLTVTFARYCLPQIFFYGVFTLFAQILNARGRFGPMMWAPILNNLVVIATFGLYILTAEGVRSAGEISAGEIRLLGIGSTAGVVVQALILVPVLRRSGFRWRPRFDLRNSGLGRTARAAGWIVLVVVVNQVGYWVVTRLSTTISERAAAEGLSIGVGYTAYANAYLLWLLPHGIVTVSLLTAVLPAMSRAAAEGAPGVVRDHLSHAVRTSATVIAPAAFFFVALGPQLATAVFVHGGQVDIEDTYAIGWMLSAFGLGLVPFSAQYVYVRTFYALDEPRAPFLVAVWITATHAALAVGAYLLLPTRWAVTGMAAGYGLAYGIGLIVTTRRLRARLGDIDGQRILRLHVRLTVAAGAAGLVVFGGARLVDGTWGRGLAQSLACLAVGGVVYIGAFLLIAHRLRIAEIGHLLDIIKNRRRRTVEAARR